MSFGKHETFHIREGWLFKGMAAIKDAEHKKQLPTIFLDDDAPERLGIGRNMVRALRFWMQATGLAKEQSEGDRPRRTVQRLTDFGEWVWIYDRYLDDEATLWLIHYHLLCSAAQATTWYWFFNYFTPVTFEPDTCVAALKSWMLSDYQGKPVAEQTLKKDVSCLIRTYLPAKTTLTPESSLESPLARLNLLSQVEAGRQPRYRLEQNASANVHPLMILYVLLDQQRRQYPDTQNRQIGLYQALHSPMNVGRTFNLNAAKLTVLLDALNKQYPHWRVDFTRTAGLDQLTLPVGSPQEILDAYVEEKSLVGAI